MHKLLAIAACSLMLLGATTGCGRSTHVSVSLGDSTKLKFDHGRSGHTSVRLTVGARECHPTTLAMSWQDVVASVSAC